MSDIGKKDIGIGGGSTAWGGITGNINAQTDLKNKLDEKANAANTYTKTEIDGQMGGKADKSDTYTKTETDEEIANAQLANQQWLSAVNAKSDLPTVPNPLQNYLCRVMNDTATPANNGVWQWIGGGTDWTYFSDNLDFIDETELEEVIAINPPTITENATKFVANTAMTFVEFWQAVINKINGVIAAIPDVSNFLNKNLSNGAKATQANVNTIMPNAMDYVVETEVSTSSYAGYRVWKSGFIEQWGQYAPTIAAGNEYVEVAINLTKVMRSAYYNIQITPQYSGSGYTLIKTVGYTNRYTDRFVARYALTAAQTSAIAFGAQWYVAG
ncbi:MAG: hypothetical protein LBV16_02470 [Elusimicrobiota bacterium]|jgi:hypothetical protein|nr:hypothetical protein [Elusimicrobiota bacterium]